MSDVIDKDWWGQHMIEFSRALSGRGAEAMGWVLGRMIIVQGVATVEGLCLWGLFLSLPARPGHPAIWDSRCGSHLVGGLCSWAVHCKLITGTFMLLLILFSS